jgi:predicted phage tail protein
MQPSSPSSPSRDGTTLLEAHRSAIEMASKLSALALNFAVDLNRTWFELVQKHVKQYSSMPQRLAQCRTPEEVYFAHTDLIEKATQDYKKDLTACADMVSKATQGYKEGLDQIAGMGEQMGREASRAMRQGHETAQSFANQASRTVERGKQAPESVAQSAKGSRGGKSGRSEESREEQAKQAH